MQKWEYLWVGWNTVKGRFPIKPYIVNDMELRDWQKGVTLQQYMDQLGNEGWDLAGSTSTNFLIFKRPKP